jgi:copper chaperone CopZ
MSEAKFFIPNISCGHCVHSIKMELGDLPGVFKVEASEATKEVLVEFEPPASNEQIVSLLQEINYAPAEKN